MLVSSSHGQFWWRRLAPIEDKTHLEDRETEAGGKYKEFRLFILFYFEFCHYRYITNVSMSSHMALTNILTSLIEFFCLFSFIYFDLATPLRCNQSHLAWPYCQLSSCFSTAQSNNVSLVKKKIQPAVLQVEET